LLKSDPVAFDNSGNNRIVNGAGSLDLKAKRATVDWVIPLGSNSGTPLIDLSSGIQYEIAIVFNLAPTVDSQSTASDNGITSIK
jgi:hypothetical protein